MRDGGVPEADLWGRLQTFLETPTLDFVPYLRISTLLWAALARKAAVGGQRRAPTHGMMNDVKTVATVLPYCDAVFVDNELAGLLGEEPLRRTSTTAHKSPRSTAGMTSWRSSAPSARTSQTSTSRR
jgi:hypothetical protein